MKLRFFFVFSTFCILVYPQDPPQPPPLDNQRGEGPKLPDGRSQQEEILKAEHKKSLADADSLLEDARDIKAELLKNDRHVVSLSMLKKLDDAEKLTKRIRSRLKHY